MTNRRLLTALAVIAMAGGISAANATSITVSTANQGGASFDASAGAPGFNAGGAITASFTYNGPLFFDNTSPQNSSSAGDLNSAFFASGSISGYSGSGTLGSPANANFTSLATFLASSGSDAGYQYGSFYTIDLGVLAAGTELAITHDDGASVYQGGVRAGTTTSGPTSQVSETVTLGGTADTILYYARENGTPSVLEVSVPEPTSMALLATGLFGLGMIRRRRAAKAS